VTLELDRRQLLRLGMAAAAAWQLGPWALDAFAGPALPVGDVDSTLEAFADTMIPGAKRSPTDRAVAGAAHGPGAVQAGALELLYFPTLGIAPALPVFAEAINAKAVAYAAQHQLVLDPGVPPYVALGFADRTRLAVQALDYGQPDYLLFYAVAALAFIAFHTAGHLHTADAVRRGHPGLKAIGFPKPDADGLWRYPRYSYKRRVAKPHPRTTTGGNPT
jgi:hypothetical protein